MTGLRGRGGEGRGGPQSEAAVRRERGGRPEGRGVPRDGRAEAARVGEVRRAKPRCGESVGGGRKEGASPVTGGRKRPLFAVVLGERPFGQL